MLKRFKMEEDKQIDTLIDKTTKLDLEGTGFVVEYKLYRSMIGSLLYLNYSSPNIVFYCELMCSISTNPKESHLHVVKRILRFLKGTTELGL